MFDGAGGSELAASRSDVEEYMNWHGGLELDAPRRPVEITARLTTANFLGPAQLVPSRFSAALG